MLPFHNLLNFWTQATSVPVSHMVKIHPSLVNSRTLLVDFLPSCLAVCTHTNLLPSTVTTVDTYLPSGVVCSKVLPILNFNSIDFNIVDVLIVHTPASSVTAIGGFDTVAAFRRKKLTPKPLRN